MNKKIFFRIIFLILYLPLFLFYAPFVLTATYFFLFTFFLITKKNDSMRSFLIASLFACAWLIIARNIHNPFHFISLFKINISPFFSWSLALFLPYYFSKIIAQKGKTQQGALFIIFFFAIAPIIGCFSFMAMPLCTCTSGPTWLKLSYLWMGPLYLIVLYIIKKQRKKF